MNSDIPPVPPGSVSPIHAKEDKQEHTFNALLESPLPLGNSQTIITNVTAPQLVEYAPSRLGSHSAIPPVRPGTANRPVSSRRHSNRPGSSASRSHVSAIVPPASFFHPVLPAKRQRTQIFLDVTQQILAEERGPDGTSFYHESSKGNHTPRGSEEGRPVSSYRPGTTSSSPLRYAGESNSDQCRNDTDLEIQPVNRKIRNWNKALGKTKFHLNGRLQTSYQYSINFITLGLIVVPSGLFFIFTAPSLWKHVSPAYPLTYAYLFTLCVVSMLKAATSDPGILPRNLHLLEKDPIKNWDAVPPTKEIPVRKDEHNKYMVVTVKYCTTCRIWRPPRSSHCRKCDNCIEFSDHHCIWLNNCIGRRNYRYFFVFVITAVILGFYLCVLCFIHLSQIKHNGKTISFGLAIKEEGVSFGLAIYAFIAALYPLALSGYHVYLISRGQSTHEFLRDSVLPQAERQRPFATSIFSNFMAVLCRPKLVSYIRPRQYYEEGDRRFEDLGEFFDSTPQNSDPVELKQIQAVPNSQPNDTPAEKSNT